jgi:hypothetical protein
VGDEGGVKAEDGHEGGEGGVAREEWRRRMGVRAVRVQK